VIISDDVYQDRYEFCKEFIDRICIYRCGAGEVLPAKTEGMYYTWQFYLRKGLFNIDFMECLADMFIYKVEREIGHFNFQLAGMETASTPMLTGIPMRARKYGLDLHAFSIRKERKEYGLMNWFEGISDSNYPVLLIDDLCNSANSLIKSYYIVKDRNLNLLDYTFTIVNKTNRADKDKMEIDKYFNQYGAKDMKFLSIYTLDDFNLNIPVGGDMYMFKNSNTTTEDKL